MSIAVEINFTVRICKEHQMYVAHAEELDVSSCARSERKALANLKEAVRLYLDEVAKMDTLETLLEEAGGYIKRRHEGPPAAPSRSRTPKLRPVLR